MAVSLLTGGRVLASLPLMIAEGVATIMLARRIMAMMVVFAVGLTNLDILLAEDPNTEKTSSPQSSQGQATVKLLPTPSEKSWRIIPDDVKQTIDQLSAELKPGEQKILINAMLVNMREGCLEECGLFPNKSAGSTSFTTLSQREASMLNALFRAKRATGEIDVYSRSTIVVDIGKTGSISGGETFQAGNVAQSDPWSGKEPNQKKISSHSVPRFTLEIVPIVDKDTGLIEMKLHASTVRVFEPTGVDKLLTIPGLQLDSSHPPSVSVPSAGPLPGLQVDSYHLAPVSVPSAGTVVVGGTIESLKDKTQKIGWLWALDAHIVRGK
jgi:hypothetical protein